MQIKIENVTKRFGSTVAVDNLSTTIESGKLVALLGPSGCGKTTTLNMLSGILPVSEGKIFFDSKDVTSLPPEKRGIGLVFQNYALYPHMTVMQNICFPLEIKGLSKAKRISRANELAQLVHITALLDRKPAELSGGQQQRVAIARALAKQPNVLLLDEPLSNLDVKLRVEMREEIRRIQRQANITTIFVTHDQEEASSIADEVLLLKNGVLQQQNCARKIYDQPSNLFVADFLGSPAINKLNGVIKNKKIVLDNNIVIEKLFNDAALHEGKEIVLAIRAESIIVDEENFLFTSVVNERYSLGKDEFMSLSIGEKQQMRAFISSDVEINQSDKLPINFKPKGVFLFDAITGERYV